MKIFFSFAHPDDETFTVGGLLYKLSKNNDVETILYSATSGDAGKCGNPPVCKKEDLGETRRNELKRAAQYLKIDHLEIGSFKDGHVNESEEDVTTEIGKYLLKYRPEIVITFPSHGISNHKDHIAMHHYTLKAVEKFGKDFVKKVYFATFTRATRIHRDFLEKRNQIDVIIPLLVDEREAVRKALLEHKTQHLSVERVFQGKLDKSPFDKFTNEEYLIVGLNHDSNINIEDYIKEQA